MGEMMMRWRDLVAQDSQLWFSSQKEGRRTGFETGPVPISGKSVMSGVAYYHIQPVVYKGKNRALRHSPA